MQKDPSRHQTIFFHKKNVVAKILLINLFLKIFEITIFSISSECFFSTYATHENIVHKRDIKLRFFTGYAFKMKCKYLLYKDGINNIKVN